MPRGTPDAPSLFADDKVGVRDVALVAAYAKAGRTLDDLPYTEEFDAIYTAIDGEESGLTRWQVLHTLQNLRKAKKLPRLGRAASPVVKVTPEEEALLGWLVAKHAGTLGRRDQLLYAREFDALVHEFNAASSRVLTPHDLWRLVAKLAK